MSENIWIALLAMFGGTILGPAIQRLFSRRNDHAKADVDEAAADASAAAEWQKLYNELKVEVASLRGRQDGFVRELADLRESLVEANNRVQIQASLLRSVCRWALLLRDELLKVGGHVPPMPPDVEAAITTLEP